MPRPKPALPLKSRYIRMSDLEWVIFKDMGGSEWLRQHLKAKARLPMKHYMAKMKGAESDTGKES